MAVHFIHIAKTGGSSIQRTLIRAGLAHMETYSEPAPDEDTAPRYVTPYGAIILHKQHGFRMAHLPEGDHVFFCLRDPVRRYVSAFNSRLRKGQPRYYVEWNRAERAAFGLFSSPQELATALGSDDQELRGRAETAMTKIRNLASTTRRIGTADDLRRRAHQLAYVGRQETLDADWEQLKTILDLPRELALPSDDLFAHRAGASADTHLDDAAVNAIQQWYQDDYKVLEYCEQLRSERGWGVAPTPGGSAATGGEPRASASLSRQPRRKPPGLSAEAAAAVEDPPDRRELWAGFVRSIDPRRVVEIGVYRGAFAEHILESCPGIETYFMIDPWRHLDEWNKPANRDDQTFERIYQEAMQRTQGHSARRVVLRGRTTEVIDQIPDESLDFAYVDADHTLRGITADLIRVYPKIRPGGWIGGDDFSQTIWQHGEQFEPTLVFPFAVHFAEAVQARIFGLPHQQFLIEKPLRPGFVFEDLTGRYGDRGLRRQFSRPKAPAPTSAPQGPQRGRRRPRIIVGRMLRRVRRAAGHAMSR